MPVYDIHPVNRHIRVVPDHGLRLLGPDGLDFVLPENGKIMRVESSTQTHKQGSGSVTQRMLAQQRSQLGDSVFSKGKERYVLVYASVD